MKLDGVSLPEGCIVPICTKSLPDLDPRPPEESPLELLVLVNLSGKTHISSLSYGDFA